MSSPPRLMKAEYLQQFGSQIPIIGREAQARLRRARVHVAGLGGIGSQIVMHLAHAGIGAITANDPQELELENLSRIPSANADSS